jgi:putative SOS response-associated peptidase YedK
MCGRFTRNYTLRQIQEYLNLIPAHTPSNFPPSFNVCPTDTIDAVVQTGAGRELQPMRWGLIPGWWKKTLKEANRLSTFNARSEDVLQKPFFRSVFGRNRCIIPATGYFEWQEVPGDKNQPWYFTPRDTPVIVFAGIWDEWRNKETSETIRSCAMMTTAPNTFVEEMTHDRMPVILGRDEFEPWLTGAAGIELCDPAPDDWLVKWPVSKRVNSSKADKQDHTLVDKIGLEVIAPER